MRSPKNNVEAEQFTWHQAAVAGGKKSSLQLSAAKRCTRDDLQSTSMPTRLVPDSASQ